MSVDKLSVSFESDLARAVRAAAEAGGAGLSRWLADAAAAKLRADHLVEFLADWERAHGALTSEEIAEAAADLGLPAVTLGAEPTPPRGASSRARRRKPADTAARNRS